MLLLQAVELHCRCKHTFLAVKGMGMNVWSFSGFTFEQLTDKKNKNYFSNLKHLNNIDVLVERKV